MIKNISQLKCVIDNKEFFLYCDPDSPLTTCKEALFQFQKYVGHLEDVARKAQEDAKAQEENKCEGVECILQE